MTLFELRAQVGQARERAERMLASARSFGSPEAALSRIMRETPELIRALNRLENDLTAAERIE